MQELVPVPEDTAPWVIPPGDPTIEGFTAWVQAVMAVPLGAMPDDTTLQVAFDQSMNLTYIGLQGVPSQVTSMTVYAQAVYNLGGAMLVEFAQDISPSTYWSDLRTALGINSFTPGLINSAHDQGTGEGMVIPPYLLNGLTLMSLQLLKSPWGRMYLMITGQWGTLWGITF